MLSKNLDLKIANQKLLSGFWNKMMATNCKISQFKYQPSSLCLFFILTFFLEWTFSIFQVIQSDPIVNQYLTTYDDFIILQFTRNFLSLEGLSSTFRVGSVAKMLRAMNVVTFILGFVYLVAMYYIWLRESKQISYVLELPYNYANLFHSFFVWVFLQFYFSGILRVLQTDITALRNETVGGEIFLLALDFFFGVLNLLIYFVVVMNSCLCYLEVNPDSRDHMAGNLPQYKRILCLLRIFMIILEVLLSSDYCLTIYLLNLIFSGIVLLLTLTYSLSYNTTLVNIKLVIVIFNSLLSLCCAIINAAGSIRVSVDPIIISAVLTPFLAKGLIIYKQAADNQMHKFFDPSTSPKEIVSLISSLLFSLGQKYASNNSEFYHVAIIGHHKITCSLADCYCKKFIKMKTEKYVAPLKFKGIKSFNQTEGKIISFITAVYEHYLNKHPNDYLLNLTYSHFLMNFVGNILKSITYLIFARAKASGPTRKYLVLKQMYEVANYMNDLNNDHHDLTNRLELPKAIEINESFDEMLIIFEKTLLMVSQFFSALASEQFNQIQLLEDINEIHTLNSDINRIFNKIYSETTHHLGSLVVYGLFQKLILNSIESNTTLAKAEELKNKLLFKNYNKQFLEKIDDLLVTDAALMTVSASKVKYGKILYANKSLCNQFGYIKSEIMNENIQRLIPNIIAGNHDRYMRDFENRGGGTFFKKIKSLFGKHKQGHLLPIQILAKPVFNPGRGLEYIGMIRLINSQSEFILTSDSGFIDSMTIGLMEELRLNSFLLNADPLNVDKIVKNSKNYYLNLLEKTAVVVQRLEDEERYKYKLETELIISSQMAQKTIEKIIRRHERKEKEARRNRKESSDHSHSDIGTPNPGKKNKDGGRVRRESINTTENRARKGSADFHSKTRKDSIVDIGLPINRRESMEISAAIAAALPNLGKRGDRKKQSLMSVSSKGSSKISAPDNKIGMLASTPQKGRRASKLFVNTNLRRKSGAAVMMGNLNPSQTMAELPSQIKDISPSKEEPNIQSEESTDMQKLLFRGASYEMISDFKMGSNDNMEFPSPHFKRKNPSSDTSSPSFLKKSPSLKNLEDFELPCICKFDRLGYQHAKEIYIVLELTNTENNENNNILKESKSRLTTRSQLDIVMSENIKDSKVFRDLGDMRGDMLHL
jgi:PAS domain S-box-containing protein